MAERIGSVADVAAGRITMGYAVFHALTGEDAISGGATVVDHPINAYQLKIQPSGDDAVQVTVVDLAAGVVWANRVDGANAYPGSTYARNADKVIRWARRLKPNTVLKVV